MEKHYVDSDQNSYLKQSISKDEYNHIYQEIEEISEFPSETEKKSIISKTEKKRFSNSDFIELMNDNENALQKYEESQNFIESDLIDILEHSSIITNSQNQIEIQETKSNDLNVKYIQVPTDFKYENKNEKFNKLIIHIDMDAYYAQVEMKKHQIPDSQPMGALQWKSLIAINYAAKAQGVKRGMLAHEALEVCPNMMFVHVSTIIDRNGMDVVLDSSICKVTKAQGDHQDAQQKWKVETRNQNLQKVNLMLYRVESKKIFQIIHRYSELIEKAGTDEAFLDVTREVEYEFQKNVINFKKEYVEHQWLNAYFMGFKDKNDDGQFEPEEDCDKKLFIANKIAKHLRDTIFYELQYKSSAGISFNKTCAKIASSQNKPNAQTLVPIRYMEKALQNIEIVKMRFCGGKISELFTQRNIHTMGEIQKLSIEEITNTLMGDSKKAKWIHDLSFGICYEPIEERGPPTSATAVKTFNKIYTFSQLEKFITLCIMDLNQKILENMEELNIFPCSFVINYQDVKDGWKMKSQRHQMFSIDEFMKDPRSLLTIVVPKCKALEQNILPGAKYFGLSAVNFKNIDQIKKTQSQKINSFFKKIDPMSASEIQNYRQKSVDQYQKLNEQIKESKLARLSDQSSPIKKDLLKKRVPSITQNDPKKRQKKESIKKSQVSNSLLNFFQKKI